jgi:hypothetical protein
MRNYVLSLFGLSLCLILLVSGLFRLGYHVVQVIRDHRAPK